jgi:dihydrodipicolinate synthase/N-acetylneuraminate lyase
MQTSFDVFVGSESFLLAAMRNGGVGTISVFSRSSLAMSVSLAECLAGSR